MSKADPVNHPPGIYKLIGGYENDRENKRSIDRFFNLSDENGFKLVIISFPHLSNDDSVNDKWIISYPKSKYNATVIDLFHKIKQNGVDLESLKIAPPDYVHLNLMGHQIIGSILYEELKNDLRS